MILQQEQLMRYQRSTVGAAIVDKKINLKKGHNSKTTAFRVMPFVLRLHLVMSKIQSLVLIP